VVGSCRGVGGLLSGAPGAEKLRLSR
jgi:hypothetical protein